MATHKLTALQVAKSKPGKLGDGGGLWLLTKARTDGSLGQRFVFRYASGGKEAEIPLGMFPDISLEAARAAASKLRASRHSGTDPAAERRASIEARKAEKAAKKVKEAPPYTFRRAIRDYLDIKAKDRWRSLRAAKAFVSNLNRYVVPIIGDTPVAEIGRAAVLSVFDPLYAHSPIMASRILGNCASIFAFVKVRRELPGENPFLYRGNLDAVYPRKPNSEHLRAIPYGQLPELIGKLTAMGDHPAALAARMQIALALRPAEARSLRFDWFNEQAGTVTLPLTKSGRPFTAPLNEAAIVVVERCHEIRSCDYLFAGQSGTAQIGDRAIYELVSRLTGGCSAHATARSCFADWAYETQPVADSVIESCLNHVIGNAVTRAYKRRDQLELRRRLMANWSDFVLGKVTLETGTVVAFPKVAS
jgi:integrase